MSATATPRELVIAAFEAPRDRLVAAWGRQVPVLLLERLAAVPGVKARLAIEGARPRASLRPLDAVLEGEVTGGEAVRLRARLLCGPAGRLLLSTEQTFGARELFARLDWLALDVAKALGATIPLAPASRPAPSTSFLALRDYLRAVDLTEESDLPLDLEDRRRKLEWLLLSVEADPSFRPAADALIEAGLRAHAKGLHDESRRALELLARLSPRDPRASYVLGELLLAEGAPDEAAAHFRRCLIRDPGHAAAALKLGILCDEEGDREGAKAHFRRAGEAEAPRVEALLLLGILCAEDGEREAAKAAFARAALLDPSGRVGDLARFELDRAERGLPIDRITLEGEGGPRALAAKAAATPGKARAKKGRTRGSARRRKAG